MPPYTRVSRAPTAKPSRNPRSGRSLWPNVTAPRNYFSATSRVAVPATTQAVLVQLVIQRFSGSDNDGMADNLSLVLSASGGKGTTSTTTRPLARPRPPRAAGSVSPQTVIVPAATVAANCGAIRNRTS